MATAMTTFNPMPGTETRSRIESIVAQLVDGWNRHDTAIYASPFSEDADFVNVIGKHWRGRAQIEAEHAQLHRTIFRASTLSVRELSVRPIARDVVVAHLDWEMRGHETPLAWSWPSVRNGVMTMVLIYDGDQWSITAVHNTDVVPLT